MLIRSSTIPLLQLVAIVGGAVAAAPSGPWAAFNYAPTSLTVRPVAIHSTSTSGSISNASALTTEDGVATLSGNETWVALDFGKEVRVCAGSRVSSFLTITRAGRGLGVTDDLVRFGECVICTVFHGISTIHQPPDFR